MVYLPLLLLILANCFMTLAWYGHLKFLPHDAPLWQAILFSWVIALFEYGLMIPATRMLAQNGWAVGQMIDILKKYESENESSVAADDQRKVVGK